MSSQITLTAATRQNLLSLQDTAALQATTQNRLSTGKKVSSALDNPVTFFTSQSLDQRSGDLSSLLDGISNGIQTIQAANQGITSIQKLVDQAKSVANQALATQITTTGTASTAYSVPNTTAATTINLFVNGSATSATLPTGATIDQTISALNSVVGAGSFSKDTTGTKIVMNASADLEFGSTTDQVADIRASGYSPRDIYEGNVELQRVLDSIRDGLFSPLEPSRYLEIFDALVNWGDHYLLLADYASYVEMQGQVDALYRDPDAWTRKAILNVAGMGAFSSDRTIAEYAHEIWHTKPVAL